MGSAHDAQYDQILDEILVGPIPVGLNKFVLQAEPPNIPQLLQQPNITSDDILGVTVVLVTCSYKEREFVRIGYYVNNEYPNVVVGDGDETTTNTNIKNHNVHHDDNVDHHSITTTEWRKSFLDTWMGPRVHSIGTSRPIQYGMDWSPNCNCTVRPSIVPGVH